MDAFINTFNAVTVILGLGLLGFFVVRRKILPESVLSVITPLVINIALPCMVFHNIVRQFNPAESPGWWKLPLYWCAFTAGLAALSLIFRFAVKSDIRGEFSLSLFYQNGLFIPTAIITGLFGESPVQLSTLFLFMILYPAFFFNTYHHFLYGNRSDLFRINWEKMLNPVLAATVLALLVRLFHLQDYIPRFALSIISQVGNITIPLIMISLGGTIYIDFMRRGTIRWAEITKFIIIKNIVFPAVTLGALVLLRPDFPVAFIILLESAVPPITTLPTLIEQENGNSAAVNQFFLGSLLFSLVSIPAALSAFSLFFTAPR
ncbi:MAG: AEC family transporter [Spirochaetes bacterium]|nr:AEC family transporter [Spirochaetota bacterium]